MDPTKRLEVIARQFQRKDREPLPPALQEAMLAFLEGHGTLAAVQQAAPSNTWPLIAAHLPWIPSPAEEDRLDALDLRQLELAALVDNSRAGVPRILTMLAYRPRGVAQACAWLRAHGVSDGEMRDLLLRCGPVYWFAVPGGPGLLGALRGAADGMWLGKLIPPSPLGQQIQATLPADLDTILAAQHPDYNLYVALARLLLTRSPPDIAAAWQLAERDPMRAGFHAVGLLAVAPDRFTAWAREVAHPKHRSLLDARVAALSALIEHDPAAHLDLAWAAAQIPLPTSEWEPIRLQPVGLAAIWQHDPAQGAPLVVAAAGGAHGAYARYAVDLLVAADCAQARPLLREVLAGRVPKEAALVAVEALLACTGPDQSGDLIALLTYPVKPVRERVAAWLVTHDPQVVPHMTPLLAARQAATRLLAIRLLQQIGGPEVEALFRARLGGESAPRVQAALQAALGP